MRQISSRSEGQANTTSGNRNGNGRVSSSSRRQSSSAGSSSNDGSSDYQQFPTEHAAAGSSRSRAAQQLQPFDIEQQKTDLSNNKRSTSLRSSPSSMIRDLFKKPAARRTKSGIRNRDNNAAAIPTSSSPGRSRSDVTSSSTATAGLSSSQKRHMSPGRPPHTTSVSYSTGKSTYQLHPRPFKGFSTPHSAMFATSGGLPTADHVHPSLDRQRERDRHLREVRYNHLRTDLCSLPCCGALQADYTRYLFTHSRPPTLCKRACYAVVIPMGLFVFAGWCAGNIRDAYVNSVVCTALVYCIFVWIVSGCIRARKKRVMVREEILWRLNRRDEKARRRAEERRERLVMMDSDGGGATSLNNDEVNHAETEDYEYYSEDDEEYNRKEGYGTSLGQSRFEMNCAHRLLGCYPSDIPRAGPCSPPDGDVDRQSAGYILQRDAADDIANGDLCTRLWNAFFCSRPCLPCIPCCNNSYGFHLVLCGQCALAQEAREANLTLPRHLRMIDYVTMEPFLLYYPRILELRANAIDSFWEHLKAISGLSKLLLVSFKVTFVALSVISLCSAIGYWDPTDVAVLAATFLQSFAVMYCVHWGWHRFDLSVDAVIKYFSCGFVLCTGMAFAVELAEYMFFKMGVIGVVTFLGIGQVQDNGYGGGGMLAMTDGSSARRYLESFFGIDDSDRMAGHGRSLAAGDDILQGFFDRNPAAKVFYILISSYVMAGLVEEVCKYFGFVMVDHPDFCSDRELEKAKATMPLQLLRDRADDDDDSTENGGDDDDGSSSKKNAATSTAAVVSEEVNALARFNPGSQRRSLSSIRSGVTVAMVAVALGFACCENILHVLIWNRSSLRSEIVTLVVKCLFPVHPIAAAIQSIYVCRRDLEKDPRIGLGRIVLPSIIFHGTYDFALLMITSSWQRSHTEQYFYQGNNDVTGVAIASLCASFFIVMVGALLYLLSSRAQYARLRGESRSDSGGSGAFLESNFGLLL